MADQTIQLRIRDIIVEKHDVKTFVFERVDGGELVYKAGQFLTFLISMYGHEIRRSYSMSSAPGVDLFPAITVKRVANGEVSRYWLDHVQVGDIFKSLEPAGRFVLHEEDRGNRDIILIGAGSGITPLFSILKQVLNNDEDSFVTLIYANRNDRHTLFHDQIAEMETRFASRLRVIHIHSQPSEDWLGIRGRINNTRLEQLVNKNLHFLPAQARFFICGPYDLMRSVEITLHYMGFGKDQIRKENFVIEKLPPPPPVSYSHTIHLTFRGEERELLVPAHTTILDAAIQSGINIPYSCKGGRCATCAAVHTHGALHMSFNEVLTDRDLAQGWILTCSAYVDGDDVRIEVR
jgi:ring-1,2-phenylacetyl-CoA epoxidase subunit PaaE